MQLNDYEIKHNDFLRQNGAECTLFVQRDNSFPLQAPGKIAIFGSGARRTIKGGTGSGEVNSRFFVNVEDGLKNAGFTITSTAWLDAYDKIVAKATKNFYNMLKADARKKHTLAIYTAMGAVMPEPDYDLPLDGDGEVGLYILSRISGEGSDRQDTKGDISLSDTEVRDILAANKKYNKFMLVINAGGVVDLSPVLEVKNILILSQLGVVTGDILAQIILGQQNPSGKLATTWTAWKDYPTIGKFGDVNDTRYNEGIYVGYRYFDSVGKRAQFPFGFGLSYTDFEVSCNDVKLTGSQVTVTANVKNTGNYAGKEVVQVYVSIPSVKLDEPYQVLAGFAKSTLLSPGSNEEVTVTFDLTNIAPYSHTDSAYILEPGDYIVRVGNSSVNTSVGGILKLDREIIVRHVRDCVKEPDFKDFIPEKISINDTTTNILTIDPAAFTTIDTDYNVSCDIDESVSKLDDGVLMRTVLGAYGLSKGMQSIVGNAGFSVAGAAGQTSLEATNYGIPSMVMADGPAGVRINRRAAIDKDGGVHGLEMGIPESMVALLPAPAQLLLKMTKYKAKKTDRIVEQYATALPIGTAIAQSFNTEFAWTCGDIVGFEMQRFGVHLWLAPALNIHRSIRCGRNFEYYSEDPLVSGLMAGAINRGVQSHPGCGVTIKHYCANNQETNRVQSNSIISERALREIYLKAFGICVRDSAPYAVMTSYNLLNGVHTSESRALADDILRCEYGFDGIIMTDWVINGFSTVKDAIHPVAHAPNVIMADGDLFMPGCESDFNEMKAALNEGKLTRDQLLISASRVARMADKLVTKK